jgi:hypothetical protein
LAAYIYFSKQSPSKFMALRHRDARACIDFAAGLCRNQIFTSEMTSPNTTATATTISLWTGKTVTLLSGSLTYHKPEMTKIKTTTIPLQGLSEYHQWMTSLLKTPT